jgi:HSP20 family molecular chaperone IbpA
MSFILGNPLSLLTNDEPFAMDPRCSLHPYAAKSHMISLDVFESPSQLCVCVDLPGLQKDQVNMRIKDNILIISGERPVNKEVKGETIHIAERVMGSFERRVRLPNSVDLNKVDASMVNGVLEVKIGLNF